MGPRPFFPVVVRQVYQDTSEDVGVTLYDHQALREWIATHALTDRTQFLVAGRFASGEIVHNTVLTEVLRESAESSRRSG